MECLSRCVSPIDHFIKLLCPQFCVLGCEFPWYLTMIFVEWSFPSPNPQTAPVELAAVVSHGDIFDPFPISMDQNLVGQSFWVLLRESCHLSSPHEMTPVVHSIPVKHAMFVLQAFQHRICPLHVLSDRFRRALLESNYFPEDLLLEPPYFSQVVLREVPTASTPEERCM